MRLAQLIKRCKAEGVEAVELHPDGSIAKLVFSAPKPVVAPKKVLTKAEELEAARAERNPVRNRVDLAVELLGSS